MPRRRTAPGSSDRIASVDASPRSVVSEFRVEE
jgi:hypothetical protein